MGSRGSKIIPMAVPIVVQRMSELNLPDDRNLALDLVEMLDINLSNKKDFATNAKQMKDANAIYVVLRLLKRTIEDVEMMSVSVQLFEAMKGEIPLVMDFIQFGGLDLLDKGARLHAKNSYVSVTIPRLKHTLLAIGAPASIAVIEEEALNLQLCRGCQETIERIKQRNSKEARVFIPKSSDRINKVLKFMDNYISSLDVQSAGLTAVINFARNADAPTSMAATNVLDVVFNSLQTHAEVGDIVWRVCMALSLIARFNADIAYEIALLDAHLLCISKYKNFKRQSAVQQQILHFLGALLHWPKSRPLLQQDQLCVDFFKDILQTFEETQAQLASANAVQKRNPHHFDKLYEVAIPLNIRAFVRESGGKVITKKKKQKSEKAPLPGKEVRPRRNFDERPKFGTVEDRHFNSNNSSGGGLIPLPGEDESGNVRRTADWELKLDAMHRGSSRKS